jgi:hypothetical protein
VIASDLILLTFLQGWQCKNLAYMYGSILGFLLTGQSWNLILAQLSLKKTSTRPFGGAHT